MTNWSGPRRLVEVGEFYERVKNAPELITDAEFVQNIIDAFWPTNCWDFVEQSFAIIAPGCILRPHLARQLIAYPIEAMIAGGLDDENEVIGQGIAFACKTAPYVQPTSEGKRWLLEQWPSLKALAIEVYREKYRELLA